MPAESDSVESDHDRSRVEDPATIARAIVRASIVERIGESRSALYRRKADGSKGNRKNFTNRQDRRRDHLPEPP